MSDDSQLAYKKTSAALIAGTVAIITLASVPVTWVAYAVPGSCAAVWDWIHRSRLHAGGVFRYGSIVHPEVTCYVEARYPNCSSLLYVASGRGIMLKRLAQHSRPHAKIFGTDVSQIMVEATQKRCPTCSVAQMNLASLLDRDGTANVTGRAPHVPGGHAHFDAFCRAGAASVLSDIVRRHNRLGCALLHSLRRLAAGANQRTACPRLVAPPGAAALLHPTPVARSG